MLLEILIHHGRMTYWCFHLKLFIGPVRVLWPSCKKVLDRLLSHLTSTMLHSFLILSCIVVVSCLAPPGDWDKFNFAPSSRVVTPTAVHSSDGQIANPSGLIGAQGNTIFSSSGSWLALDFGFEVRCSLSSRFNRDWATFDRLEGWFHWISILHQRIPVSHCHLRSHPCLSALHPPMILPTLTILLLMMAYCSFRHLSSKACGNNLRLVWEAVSVF